jgi:hypothetical protein
MRGQGGVARAGLGGKWPGVTTAPARLGNGTNREDTNGGHDWEGQDFSRATTYRLYRASASEARFSFDTNVVDESPPQRLEAAQVSTLCGND